VEKPTAANTLLSVVINVLIVSARLCGRVRLVWHCITPVLENASTILNLAVVSVDKATGNVLLMINASLAPAVSMVRTSPASAMVN